MKKLFIVLSLFLINISYAHDWKEVSNKVYVDVTTIKYDNNMNATCWTKWLNDGNFKLVENKKVWYYLEFSEYKCYSGRIESLEQISYDLKGNPIKRINTSGFPERIVPQTVGETIFKYVCGKE